MTASWSELEAAMRQRVSEKRQAHVLRVVETARDLADRFGAPRAQAEVAALMHDYARAMPGHELLDHARRRGLIIDPAEEAEPSLLHGPVGAALLAEEGLVDDPAVLDAVRWHTTGRAGMSLLEKIIWVADYIEPGRQFPGAEPVREAARRDLDEALLLALNQTLDFVRERGWAMHAYTLQARDYLLAR